ncbi:hypothetical protein [Zymobacter palmae]|uniref:hypothetical protein n=1 Tax=Zymobacter palmae TaxID=33074 RepID=UPI0011AE8E62|nr:hypothetical protein [Zymobacter palmae]
MFDSVVCGSESLKAAHDKARNHEFPSETHKDFFKKSAFYEVKTPQESESCLASKKQNGKRIKYGMPFEKKAFSFRKQCREKNDKHSASKAEKKTTSTLPQKQKRKRIKTGYVAFNLLGQGMSTSHKCGPNASQSLCSQAADPWGGHPAFFP